MTAPSIAATPQLHTAYDLKRLLDADAAYQGIPCEVEVDVWAPEMMRGAPRVTIELGDGTITEPRGHYQPGAWWPVSPTASSVGAVTAALNVSSTITHVLSGTPDASATVEILFTVGGTTGVAGASFQVSIDGGANFEDAVDLGVATGITVHGATVDLGAGKIATAGDSLTWTQRKASSDFARPMLDNEQTYILSIHAPAPPSVDSANRAAAAQDATDQLMRETMAAIRRKIAGPDRIAARTTWPKRIPNYPAFVYGSVCIVSIVITSPILDDAYASGQALQLEMTGTVDLGAGPVAVAAALET